MRLPLQIAGVSMLALVLGPAAHAAVIVYAGYNDVTRLNPWINSPNTTFLGDSATANSSDPDEAAVRLQNTGASAVTLLQGFKINYGVSLQLWDALIGPSGLTIPAGQNVILSGTTSSNMDLSEVTFTQNPVISFTLNGGGFGSQSFSFTDSTQVLHGTVPTSDETIQWTQIGRADPSTAGVPEPSTLAMLVVPLIIGGAAVYRRRVLQ